MTTTTEHRDAPRSGHPIEEFLCSVLDELKAMADVATWSLDDATTARLVGYAAQVVAGVAEVEARVVHQADVLDLPGRAGCKSLKRWLQNTTRVTHRNAAGKVALAGALSQLEHTRTAVARGEVHAEQAVAIAGQVTRLDDERVSRHDQERAEVFLLREADDRDADDLAGLGHAIWQRLDPDGADEHEARLLEAQEARARTKTSFQMRDDGDGLTHGRFAIPTAQAEMLRKQLHALAAPKHVRAEHGRGSYDWQTPSAAKLGHAFTDWIERIPADVLPQLGGLNATVVAIGDYDLLTGKVQAASLDTGQKISPTQYLRLACEAGVVPAWMNADGECLALGRRHRFHSRQQRLAKTLETRHCEHDSGCDVPAHLCHTHHHEPWADGGGTDLRTTRLYCPFHHHRVHTEQGRNQPMRT